MRVSINKTDPAYTQAAYGYIVLLDGEVLNNCHTADEELGCAWVYTNLNDDSVCLNGRVEILTKKETS
jgi:hypothetical protein